MNEAEDNDWCPDDDDVTEEEGDGVDLTQDDYVNDIGTVEEL